MYLSHGMFSIYFSTIFVQKLVLKLSDCNPVLLLQFPVLSHQGVDTVDQALHQLNLGISTTMLVGNIISDS